MATPIDFHDLHKELAAITRKAFVPTATQWPGAFKWCQVDASDRLQGLVPMRSATTEPPPRVIPAFPARALAFYDAPMAPLLEWPK